MSTSEESRGPVQVVNVYAGDEPKVQTGGIPDWLKDKLDELLKRIFEAIGAGGQGRGHKVSWQPIMTSALLTLILIVLLGQTAFVISRTPPGEHQDDAESRQLLTTLLTVLASRSEPTPAAPQPAQNEATPKIVVLPISMPPAAAAQTSAAEPARIQFDPLHVEFTMQPPDNGSQPKPSPQLPNPVPLPSLNPILITARFDPHTKCKKKSDDNLPYIYFEFTNVGSSPVWIDSIEKPIITPTPPPPLSDSPKPNTEPPTSGSTTPDTAARTPATQTVQEVIYPGKTRIQTQSCGTGRATTSPEYTVTHEMPAYAVLGVNYRQNQEKKDPILTERAAFFLAPPAVPTRVAEFSGALPPSTAGQQSTH